MGVEPTNNGFANRRLRPLGYAAWLRSGFALSLQTLKGRFKKICRGFTTLPSTRPHVRDRAAQPYRVMMEIRYWVRYKRRHVPD